MLENTLANFKNYNNNIIGTIGSYRLSNQNFLKLLN